MKLLDILKKYDRCVLRESAKLTKIYKTLLRESEAVDGELDEEVCPDCGKDPCVCESDAETDEAEEMISAEEFFGEAEADEAKDESEDNEAKDESEDNEAKDESEDNEAKDESEEETDEAEEMMSAEEFFKESEDNEAKDESEDNEAKDECDISENDEKNLEESLKSYRRANHRLFHD